MAKDRTELMAELMKNPKKIRNICICAHIDHGKTTLSDSLVAGAGMMSEDLAGTQLFMDFDKQEQERGITIFSANASMVHEYDGDPFLINLIDTPGHVDFSGDVTRAMRAVDGAIVLSDAVEGVMPQTETVVRQALRERVKPILYINKVDRLIRELKLTPQQMQERFMKIIKDVNNLILKYAEKEYAEKWLVKVDDGSVAFGSGYRKWALSVPYMKKTGITFKDVIDLTLADNEKELQKRASIHQVLLDMVIGHLPNPQDAQKYRIPKLWSGGDLESKVGKDMMTLNREGTLAAVITKVIPDPHAGMIAAARIFSGTLKRGQDVLLVNQQKIQRAQQVAIYKGPQRIQMEEIPAGNIVAITGLTDAFSGETITNTEATIQSFEAIKHIFEPVVTKSIEPKSPADLPKLLQYLRQVGREDPTLAINISEETGQYLVSGLGELHLDAKIERPLKEKGINVVTSPPIVVYRETVKGEGPTVEGVSSNRHNRFYLSIEPVEPSVYQAMLDGKIRQEQVRKYLKEVGVQLYENGMSKEESRNLVDIYNRNILIDGTKGIQYLHETIELVMDAFKNIMDKGPLAQEPCTGLKVKLMDCKLHEDAIHRGPAQVLPAVNDAVRTSMMKAKPTLLEPLQIIRIDVPDELMGSAISQVQNRRGSVINVESELGSTSITSKLPVAEMFGFEAQLKSATGGKGFYSLVDVTFDKIPEEIRLQVIGRIRERKGLQKEVQE
ncbi:MAG: elongation factor EF-2 [Candidatus Aenigmarchaeota archaeon]|nr:elongation factor EF-2 [Candidatus Aenigmarchaeota archaeon]